MRSTKVWWLASAVLVAVLFAAVASGDEARLAADWPTSPWEFDPIEFEPRDLETSATGLDLEVERPDVNRRQIPLPGWLSVIVQVALIAAAIGLAAWAWRERPRFRWQRTPTPADFDILDDVVASVAADASAQRAALAAGAPTDAIVRCWLRLERLIVDAGAERRPSDTSEEFTARVLHRFPIDADAVDRLAALYREARFSSHPMSERHRSEAVASLDAIHDGVAAVTSSAGST